MPFALDLTDRRFGRLVALAREVGSRPTRWLCRCDCGTDTTVPLGRLSSAADDDPRAVRACETCRSRRCVVCGDLYLKPGSAATCGLETCRVVNRNAVNRLAEDRAEARDPGCKSRRNRDYVARARADPLRRAVMLDRDRALACASRARRTPEQAAARRETAKALYDRDRERIRAAYDAWVDGMPPDRRMRWSLMIKKAGQDYRRRRALGRMTADAAALLDRS